MLQSRSRRIVCVRSHQSAGGSQTRPYRGYPYPPIPAGTGDFSHPRRGGTPARPGQWEKWGRYGDDLTAATFPLGGRWQPKGLTDEGHTAVGARTRKSGRVTDPPLRGAIPFPPFRRGGAPGRPGSGRKNADNGRVKNPPLQGVSLSPPAPVGAALRVARAVGGRTQITGGLKTRPYRGDPFSLRFRRGGTSGRPGSGRKNADNGRVKNPPLRGVSLSPPLP